MENSYEWLKALHILAFSSWMLMLLYLPKLFAYHASNIENKSLTENLKIQESKLYYLVGIPAMIVTLLSGIGLIVVLGGGVSKDFSLASS